MAIDKDKLDRLKKRFEVAAAKKKQSEIDKKDDSEEISGEREKQKQLQKIKEDADLWEERRNKLKDKSMEIAADPQAWLKGFLVKKATEAGHYAISKKRRLEVAASKEKESKIGKKNNSDKLKTAVELKKLEIEPSEIKFGFEATQLSRMVEGIEGLTPILEDIKDLSAEQLKTDKSQFKANNRTSAAEEAAASGSKSGSGIGGVLTGGSSDKNRSVVEDGVDGIMSTIQDVVTEGAGGMIAERAMGGLSSGTPDKKPSSKTKSGGLKGILKNIMTKFGKAGKFLMSLGARFLTPLITTPVGWAVLAGLAVGGLVFAYWDDIVSFVGKMFDGVKSMFSKVVSKISGMFSAVGNAIKDVISFFNPMNLLPMIAKALLPPDMYGAVSSFFGGDNAEEIKSKEKKETLKKEMAVGDKMEAELSSAKSEQRNLGKSLKSKYTIAAEKDGEVITIKVGQVFEGTRLRSPNHANWKLKQAGYKVLSPEETNAIMEENAKDIKLREFDLDVQMKREEKLIDDVAVLDESIATGKTKNDKPGNVVADLVRAGTAEYNIFGNSTIKDWPALQKLDYESLEKVLAFDDWGDKTKRSILGIMNSKKKLIGANDLEPIKPNEISVLRKDEITSGALQKGMDNKILSNARNDMKEPIQQSIVSAPVINNSTTIRKEGSYDTDITSMSLNKSAMMFPQQDF